jgi:hypothetical protein
MFRTAPEDVAKQVLSKTQDEIKTPIILPTYKDLNGNVSKEIIVKNPTYAKTKPTVKTGASDREAGVSLDEKLRKERIYGNRSPVVNTKKDSKATDDSGKRDTGAVSRSPNIISSQTKDKKSDNSSTNSQKKSDERRQSPPIRQEPKREPPKSEPKRDEPKYEPPPRRDPPKYDPPPRRDPPKYDPPPPREQPKNDPPPPRRDPPKNDPPPSKKSEPPPPEKKGKPLF